jgi:hypothetical protein
MQVWPVAAKMPATTPLAAASRSASSKTMLGDLPRSSKDTRARLSAASFMTLMPVSVEPVNESCELERGRGSLLGRLGDDGAARRQRGGQLPADEQNG